MKCSLPAKAWSRYIQLWLALVLPTSLIKQLVGFPGFLDEETRVGERKQSLCLSKEPWRLEVEWTLPSLPCPIHPVTECWFCNHWWCQIFFFGYSSWCIFRVKGDCPFFWRLLIFPLSCTWPITPCPNHDSDTSSAKRNIQIGLDFVFF